MSSDPTPADAFDEDSLEAAEGIEDLLEEYLEELRKGEAPSVEVFANRMPAHAEEIRGLLRTASAMERSKPNPAGSGSGPAPNSLFGDFRLGRIVGRGGMGVVYDAEQLSLQRSVALKVLPIHNASESRQTTRFMQEAQTAARLHHTNIVPIYESGEQDGYHFYAMQFIRGIGLDLVLRELFRKKSPASPPSPEIAHSNLQPAEAVEGMESGRFVRQLHGPRSGEANPFWLSLADIGHQVAGALTYAHAQGTLHRDIKPANLLLDGDGVVWVADFGLARAMETDGMTRTGDVLGTIRYMAPEQLAGTADSRSDVYGIGLSLYELAVRAPAYADRQDGSLVSKVRTEAPTPPHQLAPDIPSDLETILTKSIAPDPAHRYQTAAEFERDLRLFLEDRPILARRTSNLEHAWRWCRRNQLVASACAVALLAVTTAAVVGWIAFGSTNAALQEAREASHRAEANLQLGMQAFEEVFQRVTGLQGLQVGSDDNETESDLSTVEVSTQEAAVLEQLLGFYDELAHRNASSPSLLSDAARAYHRVGQIQQSLGRRPQALEALKTALSRYESLPDPSLYVLERARIHNDIGSTLQRPAAPRRSRTGPRPPSLPTPEQVAEVRQAAVAARTEFRAAEELLKDLDTVAGRLALCRTYDHLGAVVDVHGKNGYSARREFHQQSLALAEGLVRTDEDDARFQEAVARSHQYLADVQFRVDDEAASMHRGASIRILNSLRRKHRDQPRFTYQLVRSLLISGERGHATRSRYERAWTLSLRLVDRYPDSSRIVRQFLETLFRLHPPEYRRLFANPPPGLPSSGRPSPDPRAEEICYTVANEKLNRVRRSEFGDNAVWIATAQLHLGRLYRMSRRPDQAERVLQRTLRNVESADGLGMAIRKELIASCWVGIAKARDDRGDAAAANLAYKQAARARR